MQLTKDESTKINQEDEARALWLLKHGLGPDGQLPPVRVKTTAKTTRARSLATAPARTADTSNLSNREEDTKMTDYNSLGNNLNSNDFANTRQA